MKIRESGDFDIITKKPKLELVNDSGETLATATIDAVINPFSKMRDKSAPYCVSAQLHIDADILRTAYEAEAFAKMADRAAMIMGRFDDRATSRPWVPILKTAPHDRSLRRHTRHGDMLAIIHANEDCGTLLIDGLDAGALIYNDAACQFRFVASGKIAAAPEVLRAMLTVLEEFFEMLESPEFGQTPPMEPTP